MTFFLPITAQKVIKVLKQIKIINKCWAGQTLPDDWEIAYVSTILKKEAFQIN